MSHPRFLVSCLITQFEQHIVYYYQWGEEENYNEYEMLKKKEIFFKVSPQSSLR